MLDPRLLRVILTADAYTRAPRDDQASWDELCNACEQVTDAELKSLRAALASADTETLQPETFENVLLLADVTFGQGSYGVQCEVCQENDYSGMLIHKPGCREATLAVIAVREGSAIAKD